MSEYQTTWWEKTDKPASWKGNIGSPILRNMATGEELPSRDLPVGALTWSDSDHYRKGNDGLAVMCKMPGGHTWYIDSRASNCTRKDDDAHRCWCRHGSIGDCLTVDKVGDTCAAGAGSIIVPGYHGFLRAGKLVPA